MFLARPKNELHLVLKLLCWHKTEFTEWKSSFGPAQNVLELVEGRGISKYCENTLFNCQNRPNFQGKSNSKTLAKIIYLG